MDTFDIAQGIRNAVEAAGPRLRAIRIDSGDLQEEVSKARILLDELGAADTQIIVSGDLDEHRIAALADAPVDSYMVGTHLVTGSGAPAGELVYKVVAVGEDDPHVELRAVAKLSIGKVGRGGSKVAGRILDRAGRAVAELVGPPDAWRERPDVRPLVVPFVREGEAVSTFDLDEAKAHHRMAMGELRPEHLDLTPGAPALMTTTTTVAQPERTHT